MRAAEQKKKSAWMP